jgi:hypothetical protein
MFLHYSFQMTNIAVTRINTFIGIPRFQYCKHHGDTTEDSSSQQSYTTQTDGDALKRETNVEMSSSETFTEKNFSMKGATLPEKDKPPDLPTSCCMTGCSNCVWIGYAEELAKYYGDGGAKAREAIKQIPDQNLRAFLEMEIKFR